MAANWWKYGLCVFGGLGVGYFVGVKITKNRIEEEAEQKIADIREIYRNDNRSAKPKKNEEKKESEQPDISTKTSIDTERLSARRNKAEQAEYKYGQAFRPQDKPDVSGKSEAEAEDEEDWSNYIHIVSGIPEDSTYKQEVLCYYMDGVLAYQVSGKKMLESDIPHYIGKEALKLLEDDGCNQVYVRNDLYGIDYTIIFRYDEWTKVIEEEPYKAEL